MKKHMHEQNRLWDYEIIKQLGKGQYGQVYQVRLKKDNQIYALKKIHTAGTHQKQKIQAFREIKALKLISHPDIIEYYDSFMSMDNIYIVTKFAQKGDLSMEIKNRIKREKKFTEDELWNIFEGLVSGVKYLHEKNIIHRDIKLENIFHTAQGKYKIGDLGMSKIIHHPSELISTRVGTPVYFAPEMIQHKMYSFPVDIWALGCVFYYMATLQHPYKDATIQTLGYYVVDKDPKPIKGTYSPQLIEFINSLLDKNSNTRPTIHDVYKKLKERKEMTITNKISIFNLKKILKLRAEHIEEDQKKKLKNKIQEIESKHIDNKNRMRIYENLNKNSNPEKNIEEQSPKQKRNMSIFLPKASKQSQSSLGKSNEKQYPECFSPMIKSNGFSINLSSVNNFSSPEKISENNRARERFSSMRVRQNNWGKNKFSSSFRESPNKIQQFKKILSKAEERYQ